MVRTQISVFFSVFKAFEPISFTVTFLGTEYQSLVREKVFLRYFPDYIMVQK